MRKILNFKIIRKILEHFSGLGFLGIFFFWMMFNYKEHSGVIYDCLHPQSRK